MEWSKNNQNLLLSSYNVRGLPKCSRDLFCRQDILQLLRHNDILCVQETWFSKQDLPKLSNIHEDFHGFGAATVDYRDGVFNGHPPGGVAILWNSRLDEHVTPIELNCDWAVAVRVTNGDSHLTIVNVYLPYQCSENEDKYLDCLGALNSMVEELQTTAFVIIGDWNANLRDISNSPFARHMLDFCEDNGYIISSQSFLPAPSHTFVSEAWGTYSWLDHVVSSQDFHSIISNIVIEYEISDEDHIPVTLAFRTDLLPSVTDKNNVCGQKRHWENLSDEDRYNYCVNTDKLLLTVCLPEDALRCQDMNCSKQSHIMSSMRLYNDIVNCLKHAADASLPKRNHNEVHNKPGWADHAQELYVASRDSYRSWCDAGKPRQGPIFDLHKSAKARFKYARRFIKNHESQLRRESLAKKLYDLDPKSFWKEIKYINDSSTPLPTSVEGVSGEDSIAHLWRKHYSDLFNCLPASACPNWAFDGTTRYCDAKVGMQELESVIKDLDLNKACGLDGIYAEHLKFSSRRILVLLSLCFTSLFVHGALPDSLISVVLLPIIKDKAGKISSKENYRPIALASIISKVLEGIILNRISDMLETHHNQFGFKKKHGTDQCLYVLKETIDAYRLLGSSVFICFLDASKAFDRVHHGVLFEKLVKRKVPIYIVRLLVRWYNDQRVCVKWGNVYSDFFQVSNGVRQGGILSPYLFNVYVDDLSCLLKQCNIGCSLSGERLNHLMYADDLAVIAPSISGLQELIYICEQFGRSHEVKFNVKKSAVMYFRSKLLRNVPTPGVTLYGDKLKEVDKFKYLGNILTSDLSDDLDIARQRRQLYMQGNILLRKFSMCSLDVRLRLFKSYCAPMYNVHLWWNYKSSSIRCLHSAHHTVLKLLLGFSKFASSSLVCCVFNVQSCPAILRKNIYKFLGRLDASDNRFVKCLLSSSLYFSSRIRQHWIRLIYIL